MTHTWWYLARSAGIVAWFLLMTSVLWGLLLSTRVFDRRPSPKWLTDLHRFLGGIALVFTALHMSALVADSYVQFGVKELLVPFASRWHPVAVAWGVISLWILVAVEITSYLMHTLPRRLWHAIHMSSFGIFVAATVHAVTAGTDARNLLFVTGAAALSAVVLLLAAVRFAAPRRRERGPSAVPAATAASLRSSSRRNGGGRRGVRTGHTNGAQRGAAVPGASELRHR